MKKTFVIIIAFIAAIFINELIVRFAIGYPSFGLDKKVQGIRSPFVQGGWQNLYKPNSYYWNVEGGNIKERRNNYGLPGNDVIINDKKKYNLFTW